MLELEDRHGLEPCAYLGVEVRVLSLAQIPESISLQTKIRTLISFFPHLAELLLTKLYQI